MEVSFSHLYSAGYLLVAVKEASSIFVNQLNAKNLKWSKTQFQFQFELSLAQLSPSLSFYLTVTQCYKLLFRITRNCQKHGLKVQYQHQPWEVQAKVCDNLAPIILNGNAFPWAMFLRVITAWKPTVYVSVENLLPRSIHFFRSSAMWTVSTILTNKSSN